MINCVVVFGGKSCEHDISIVTGGQVISKLDEYLYKIIPIYIDKNGEWFAGDNLKDLDNFPDNLGKLHKVAFVSKDNNLYIKKGNKFVSFERVDVAILCLHGMNSEDGCVASVFENSGIPYSSTSIMGSSLCLDKSIFKFVCKGLSVSVVDGLIVDRDEFEKDSERCVCNVINFGLPVIIKPSRLGSSVGIEVCKSEDKLKKCLESAFIYDDRVVVEKFLDIKKEINIALFDNKGSLVFSQTEEPVYSDTILSFDDKYLKNPNGFEGIGRIKPANIDKATEDKIKDIAGGLYRKLKMFGVVRFDFILTKSNELFVNEVNTIPGSMANYLFDKIEFGELLDLIVSNSVYRCEIESKTVSVFDSDFLKCDKKFIKK